MDQKINDTKPLIWICLLFINFRFSGRFSRPTKTSNKDISHNNSFWWPSGLGNYFVCKRFEVQSNPHVITGICDPTKYQHDTSTIQFLSKNVILQTSPHSTLLKIYSSNTAKNLTHFKNFPENLPLVGVR